VAVGVTAGYVTTAVVREGLTVARLTGTGIAAGSLTACVQASAMSNAVAGSLCGLSQPIGIASIFTAIGKGGLVVLSIIRGSYLFYKKFIQKEEE
jgi:hypothetical protein